MELGIPITKIKINGCYSIDTGMLSS